MSINHHLSMATGGFDRSLRGKNATLPPRRGGIMSSILEDLMRQKEKGPSRSPRGRATNFVPRRGMIKLRILEDMVQHERDPSRVLRKNPTSPVPRRGMIKLRILEDFVQMLVFPAPENFDAVGSSSNQ